MYRDNELPAPETLKTWAVTTKRGGAWVTVFGCVGMLVGVCAVVLAFADIPPEAVPLKIPSYIATAVPLLIAYVLQSRRKRELVIVRRGQRIWLRVVRENVELELPLRLSGSQMIEKIRNLPISHVYLKLSDKNGRGLLLHESRGAAYGAVQDWWEGRIEDATPCQMFEANELDLATELRKTIETLNTQC